MKREVAPRSWVVEESRSSRDENSDTEKRVKREPRTRERGCGQVSVNNQNSELCAELFCCCC